MVGDGEGIASEWHASEDILKDFIAHGRAASEARREFDLPWCYHELKEMFIGVAAFIGKKWDEAIRASLKRCRAISRFQGEKSDDLLEPFEECEILIRRAAQAAKLLIKEADSWDQEPGEASKIAEDIEKWQEKRKEERSLIGSSPGKSGKDSSSSTKVMTSLSSSPARQATGKARSRRR